MLVLGIALNVASNDYVCSEMIHVVSCHVLVMFGLDWFKLGYDLDFDTCSQLIYEGWLFVCFLLVPAPTGTGTIALDPTFTNLTLLESVFTLGEPFYLTKMFKLFRFEMGFFGVQSVKHSRWIKRENLGVRLMRERVSLASFLGFEICRCGRQSAPSREVAKEENSNKQTHQGSQTKDPHQKMAVNLNLPRGLHPCH